MIDSFNHLFADFGLFGLVVMGAISSAILVRDHTE
jgi:hypothetical protein